MRGVAFLIDELIRWAVIVVTAMTTGVLSGLGVGLWLIVTFICYWLYGVIFEVFNNGQTPGKKMYGLQVVHDDGTPIRLPASLVRNLLLTVDLLPFLYVFAIVSMALSRGFRRVGDHVAGTMVVYRDLALEMPSAEVTGTRPPPLPLSVDEQSLFLSFLDRKERLSHERGEELAEILTPLIDCRGERAVDAVLRIGNGVRGGS